MSTPIKRLGVFLPLLLGASLFAIGMLAMNHIVDNWWPFDVERLDLVRDTGLFHADAAMILEAINPEILLAFLATVLVTVTGLVLPLTYLLNRRLHRPAPGNAESTISPSLLMTLRQSMWVGLWVAFCAWLQMNRTLGIAVASLVAGVLVLFEMLLQVRTKAATVSKG